jgi:exonuclease III
MNCPPSKTGFHTRHRFKCLQTNLRHSQLASASLAEVILENSLDVILIQEPYALCSPTPTLAHIPPGYIAFHALSADRSYGVAILVKLSLANSCRAVSCCAKNHIAAVDLKTAKGTVRFISAYLHPTISNYLATLQSELSSLITPLTVLSVDANAKNRLWNSSTTDRKGEEFE